MKYFSKTDKPSNRYFQKSSANQAFFSKHSKKGSTNPRIREEKEKVKYSPLERRHPQG